MDALDSSDADESLVAVVQRCELQIAALAGRLDAESVRRSAATREISATVESQLVAVRSTVQGLAVLRAAVEEIDDELEELGQRRAVTESHAVALDARVTNVVHGVETQLEDAEQKLAQLHGAVDTLRVELEAVRHVAPEPGQSGIPSHAERSPHEDPVAQAEMATLRRTLTEARAELARLGQALQRAEHDVAEMRGEIERSAATAASAREAARALVEGVRDDVAELRADAATATGAVRTARAESEATVELLRADVAAMRDRLDDASRAMDTMHGTMTAVGGDVGSLQDACEAAVHESTAVREAIAALRSESEEHLAAATLRSRDEVAEVREAVQRMGGELGDVRGAVARLDGEIGTVRDTVGRIGGDLETMRGLDAQLGGQIETLREDMHALRGEVRHAAEDLDAARGLIAILRDESATGDRAIGSLRQMVEGAREEARVATGAIGAARDEMDLVHAGLERTQEETRALREELSSLRRDAVPTGAVPAAVTPEGLLELTDAVEALRSGLARQDVLVDARITTSHRATEALRGELTEMRAQMQEMVTLMRDQAPAARPASVDPLAALLETLGGQVTTLRQLAERVPGGRLLWAAVFPAPVLSLATALVRRFASRPS